MTRRVGVAAALVLAGRIGVLAQAPGFAGTWKLDVPQSRISTSATMAGLAGSGAPATLHITQAANGTLVVESQINESHARMYTPGRTSTTPVTVGPPGSVTMVARWDGRRLVNEGTRETSSGASTTVTKIKEVFTLGVDGRTLTIELTATDGDETSVSTATYTRTGEVGPCQSWPTPCKMPS